MICGLWVILMTHNPVLNAQTIYQYKQPYSTFCFFDKSQSQYIPLMMRRYQSSKALHKQIWNDLPQQPPFIMVADLEDDGNAGAGVLPHTTISIRMSPLNTSYFINPANERYLNLFRHEYTHVVMSDKANNKDKRWRNFTGNKVVTDSKYPLSALWSYLDTPRWYAPRWYHEGIACFMETWLNDGVGRALGGYDETYFRTQISEDKELYSVVGLETEGTSADFQQGATSYLYGTRFVNYLALTYGYEKLIELYNRTEDSKAFYAKQFENVYGNSLRQVWSEWQEYEKKHQQENLVAIAEYPLTDTDNLVDCNLGATSPMIIDEEVGVAYIAVNHPGDFSQIDAINLNKEAKGKRINRIAYIDGAMVYQTAYLAYDKRNQRLIWTDRNGKMRGLVVYDLKKGKKVKHLKYQRTDDISYDNVNNCLYGLMSSNGICHLVRYDSEIENREILYSFPFGVSVNDLNVSHDGTKIVAALLGTRGQHSLIMFNTSDFENAAGQYEVLYSLDDSNLSQFRFSEDDSKLVGFSYYTGVPNIWVLDLASRDFDLLTNVETGMFAPYLNNDSTVYALEYSSEGMTPVTFDYRILNDANSVEFLGQKAFMKNPELADLSTIQEELPEISFGQVYDSITVYNPFKEMKFQGAYPDISGFTDRQAWNNMTPVLGYHLSFYDPLSVCSVNLFLGASPWSNNDWKNRFHAMAELKYWNWTLNASWNKTSFYDLFGPRRSSRKGYSVSLAYDVTHSLQTPFVWGWGGSLAHYGDLDALPMYQEIEIDNGITSFQTLDLYINAQKTRKSLGGIEPEQGFKADASANVYLVDGKLFPSVSATFEQGVLLPVGKHNSFWLRGTFGQNFGDSGSSFGNDYFGGFRNNYVDNGAINRYRTTLSMPGADIDAICAHSYAKFNGEISFSPIRLNNFGALQCYPNYIQINLFANDLMADYWGSERCSKTNYISVGSQVNIPLVLFTHMQTTLSAGYARIWGGGIEKGEFMLSLKLL